MSRYPFESNQPGGMGQLQFPQLSPAVKWLLIINAVMQLVQLILAGRLSVYLGLSLGSFATFPLLGVVHLFTYQIVHSIGLGHILMNLLVLYFFGTMVERDIGTRRFIRLYVACGVAGGLLWLIYSGLAGIDVPVIGASGCCYGILLYAACRNPNAQVIFIIIFVRLWWLAAIFGVIAVYNTVGSLHARQLASGTADAAHLGGMLWALAYWRFGTFFNQLGVRAEARAVEKKRQTEKNQEKELDRLLSKINESGMNSLSRSERQFLAKYSEGKRR